MLFHVIRAYCLNAGNIRSLLTKLQTSEDVLKFKDVFKDGSTTAVPYFQVEMKSWPVLQGFSRRNVLSNQIFVSKWMETSMSILRNGAKINLLVQKPPITQEDEFLNAFHELSTSAAEENELKFPLDLNGVITYVLVPALIATRDTFLALVGGTMRIDHALKVLEKNQDLQAELEKLRLLFRIAVNGYHIKLCVRRLECAIKIKDCVEQSECILQAAKDLNLQGDFENVKKILEKVSSIKKVLPKVFYCKGRNFSDLSSQTAN